MQSRFRFIMRHPVFRCAVLLSILLTITNPTTSVASPQSPTLRALSSFLTELEKEHPQLKTSQAEREAAQARTRAAAQPLYNPEIELDIERVGFNSNKVDTTTVAINQTIDWHDKRSARKNSTLIAQKAVAYEQQAVRQRLIARIFSALADYHLQGEMIQAHNKRLALAKQILAQATQRYNAGDISKLALEQTRLNQTTIQLTLDQAKTQLATKTQTLIAAAATQRRRWPTLPYAPPPLQAAKIPYKQLVTQLPTIKALRTRVTEARSITRLRVREQKADPSIGIKAGGENGDKVMGFTLSIPLYVRNNYRAEVDEARANSRRTESHLESTQHQLKTTLQSAAQSYQLSYARWQTWQKVANSSLQQQANLLMRLWKAGELSTTDYLLQLNQIKAAELNNVELKGSLWKAWFNWLASSHQFKQWLHGQIK